LKPSYFRQAVRNLATASDEQTTQLALLSESP
jgi:hypothetical protein